MSNSFGLLRTNVGLTTNIKIMVDSNYSLSLDSIDSNSDLTSTKLKKVQFNKKNYWDELIKYFFDKVPTTTAFYIKNGQDQESMVSDFSNQYDEIYQYGARNIINNKNYSEEFEYFAPLYIKKNSLPKYFIIFRIDGPGVINLNRTNFKQEILQKLKVVKIFDMTLKTNLGEWLDINFSEKNSYFPDAPLEMDFRTLEFCRWNGISLESGGYISNSVFIDDILDEEKEIFELEKFIFDKFRDTKVAIANILNFSFLFDDEPSTPEFKRKWSLNRYLGFYLDDIEQITSLSPYITPFLKSDVVIKEQNILFSASSEDPFVEGWTDKKPFYVEYNGQYYKVEQTTQRAGINLVRNPTRGRGRNTPKYAIEEYSETFQSVYKIISDLDLKGKQNLINKNFGYIDKNSILMDYNNNPLVIKDFDDADVWLIEIDNIFHKLSKINDGSIKIISDYSFLNGVNKYDYTIAGTTKSINTIVDFNNPPKKYNIYRLKFTDIKDFDDRIIDTEFSKFEYEKKEDLTQTDESKMYLINLNSGTNPPTFDDFIYKGQVVNIPTSSEYTANLETFKVENNNLTNLWRKNAEHCRWAYQNSISSNDYPYLLNNSSIMEDFNRTTNTYESEPKRIERNLDYFYTVNPGTSSYIHHSLHVCGFTNSGQLDTQFKFELDKYLNLATFSVGTTSATYSYDYFSYFFDRKTQFENGKIQKNTKKFSIINSGDKIIPNLTLFRGIKFFIYDVDSIKKSENGDLDINLKNSNTFDDYKFSILLSDNDLSVNEEGILVKSTNSMDWKIVDEWKMDQQYATGSIGIFDDILYISQVEAISTLPTRTVGLSEVRESPHVATLEWSYLVMTHSIFWRPNKTYNDNLLSSNFYNYIVYNSGEYYLYNSLGTENFWNPSTASSTGYQFGEVVLYKNQYFMSMTSSNNQSPDNIQEVRVANAWQKYWSATQSKNPKWSPIELWNPNRRYRVTPSKPIFVVHNDVVYKLSTNVNVGEEPSLDSDYWQRIYSIKPDTDYVYNNTLTGNPIIEMNNKYYLLNSNQNSSTLDNGIVVYINKKWKNILVNINIADNTLPNISNADRDLMYTDINKKITANNFILAINDIRNKYGFTDYVSYVVIDENGKLSKYKYDSNITSLPYVVICETAEDLDIKVNSLKYSPIQLSGDLVAKKSLSNGTIKNISELNYYNNIAIGATIEENKFTPKIFDNYHGNQNITTNRIYRYTGNYMPLFYDIELFQKNYESSAPGNYKFDTNLTNFGIMKERRISKINRKGNLLKLKNSKNNKPIFPMLDEFGYTIDDFFIFSSTWDLSYHVETLDNDIVIKEIKPFVASEVKPSRVTLTDSETEEGPRTRLDILDELGQPPIDNSANNESQNIN